MTHWVKVPEDVVEMYYAVAEILFAMFVVGAFAYITGYKRGKRAGLRANKQSHPHDRSAPVACLGTRPENGLLDTANLP